MKKRITIFAHFDKDNIIDDYVIHYLLELKKISEKIIFVSDSNLDEVEKNKLSKICCDVLALKHGEYDFGSYKRGFFLLKSKYDQEFSQIDEVVFANDSCYLIRDFETVFLEMEKRSDDFWGIAESFQHGYNHLHSYFMVFRSQILQSKVFDEFLSEVKIEKSHKEIIVKYEVGLSKILVESGFKMGSLCGKTSVDDIGNKKGITFLISQKAYPFLKIKPFISGYVAPDQFIDLVEKKIFSMILNNLTRRIGASELIKSYSILKHHDRFFIHKKLFLLRFKNHYLILKLFCLKILKINLNNWS
jgi:hypothetical protein